MRKILFALMIFLPALIFAASFSPGEGITRVFEDPHIQSIQNTGAAFLGFLGCYYFVKNVIMMVVFGKSSVVEIVTSLAKYIVLIVIFNSGPAALTSLVDNFYVEDSENKIVKMSDAFTQIDASLTMMIMGKPIEAEEKILEEKGFWEQVQTALSKIVHMLSFQTIIVFFLSLMIKGLLVLSMASKYLCMDTFWPYIFQFTVAAFVFSIPLASIEGGFMTIKSFFMNVIEVLQWPFIYAFCFSFTIDQITKSVNDFSKIISSDSAAAALSGITAGVAIASTPATLVAAAIATLIANLPLIAEVFAYLIFLIFLPFLAGTLAHLFAKSEGVSSAGHAIGASVGGKMMATGSPMLASIGAGVMSLTKGENLMQQVSTAAGSASGVSGASGAQNTTDTPANDGASTSSAVQNLIGSGEDKNNDGEK